MLARGNLRADRSCHLSSINIAYHSKRLFLVHKRLTSCFLEPSPPHHHGQLPSHKRKKERKGLPDFFVAKAKLS